MSDQNIDKVAALCTRLGFAPARQPTGDGKVLASVIEEIQKERETKVRGQLKELMVKAMDVRTTIDKARKAFDGESRKYEKELGKILNEIDRLASGKPAPEATEEEPAPAAAE